MTEQGALNDAPALETLREILSVFPDGYKKTVVLAAADVDTGAYHQFTDRNTSWNDLHRAAMSSASIPGIFPPQKWNGTAYMDGGTIWNINIDAAVKECLAKGFAEEEIVLDISICFYETVDEEPAVSKNAFQNWLENWHVHRFYGDITSTYQEMQAYPNVQFRYYMMNTDPALAFKMLNFNQEVTWPLQEVGRAAAQTALNAGSGVGFKAVKNWMEDVDEVKSKFKNFAHYYQHHMKPM